MIGQLERVLFERGHTYIGEAGPPDAVSVRRCPGVSFAHLRFGGSDHLIVIKAIGSNSRLARPSDLFATHDTIRALCPSVRDALPLFLGFDDEHGFVVIEYVPGTTLESVLRTRSRSHAALPVRLTARVLAGLHAITGDRVGLSGSGPRSNESYIPRLAQLWEQYEIARLMPREWRTPDALLDGLPANFFTRIGTSLIPHDCQPKNVIVVNDSRVVLVDIDYIHGNAAISVAAFLASLDRTGAAHLTPTSGRIEFMKAQFLDEYRQAGGAPEVLEDLVFFYPWILVQVLERHISARPMFQRYLTRYYGARLRQFVNALRRSDATRRPCARIASAFGGAKLRTPEAR